MLLYQSLIRDAYFNIATEEYFLKRFDDDFFYLYINEPAIVVGKHQNTMAEINVHYAYENHINVVRRLSGGGTVFHDTGNLNYCFIQKGVEGHLVDFKKHTQIILDTVQSLGVDAQLKGKSDLVIDGLKFSGNAEHVYRNKVLHHGTMLFASELNHLNNAIKNDRNRFNDKAVRSNRSKVTNIISHLQHPLSIDEFRVEILNTLLSKRTDIDFYQLTREDEDEINKLVAEKYSTWKWNFGYSPKYAFTQKLETPAGQLNIVMDIDKGLIESTNILLDGDVFHGSDIIEISLLKKQHSYPVLQEALIPVFNGNTDLPVTFDHMLQLLF